MLTINSCISIAQNACIGMFGETFVEDHKEGFCSTRYLNPDTGMFEYSLLYAPIKDEDFNDNGLLIDSKPFDYYASVLVDMQTGAVRVDPDKSKTKLPQSSNELL